MLSIKKVNLTRAISLVCSFSLIACLALIVCQSSYYIPEEVIINEEEAIVIEEVSYVLLSCTGTPDVAQRSIDSLVFLQPKVYPATPTYEETVLAQTVWGEARGCDETQQASVVWCILNRIDSGHPSWANRTPAQICAQPGQFAGYISSNPVTDEILALVRDVLERHELEQLGGTPEQVGRVLPARFTYFTGNSVVNKFTTRDAGQGEVWNWTNPSPYANA